MRLYSCKIWKTTAFEGVPLIRDFIPCKNASGEVGLWDDVNSVFYGNAGTGAFIAGEIPSATHKTLVNGTAYEVKGGKCLVNGTVYNIKKGRTLIDGTGYDINFEPDVSLTWYFNQTLSIPVSTTSTTFSTRAHYEGDSKTITGIQIINRGDNPNMSYLGSGFASTAGDQRRGWRDTAYRTITFDEAPSGDLLAWLQENATPQ